MHRIRSEASWRVVRSLAVLLALGGIVEGRQCTGQPGAEAWSGPYDWRSQLVFGYGQAQVCGELEISHAALIPRGILRGKVLIWRKERTNTPPTCIDSDTDVTWIYDPSNPTELLPINQALNSDIFCGGLSWDRHGQLIVCGGVPTPECLPTGDCGTTTCILPVETYRFRPQQLDAGITPGGKIVLTGNPWKQLGSMLIRRYYPTVITLGKTQLYRSDDFDQFGPPGSMEDAPLPLSTTMVAGGPACGGGEGNEYWELLPPALTGTTPWEAAFIPKNPTLEDPDYAPKLNSPNFAYFPPPTGSGYDPYERPAGLTNPLGKTTAQPVLDSYPRMYLTSFKSQILVCGDVDTSSTPANAAGSVWVIKPRFTSAGSPNYWQSLNGPIGPSNWHDSFYDTAVLLHEFLPGAIPNHDRVLMFGGARNLSGTWTVNDSVWEFDKNESSPNEPIIDGTWEEKRSSSPDFKRLYANAVVLPTGDIFVEGGTSTDDTTGHSASPTSTPFYTPFIYDPEADFTYQGTIYPQSAPNIPAGAQFPTARLYHHVALLLPDGRVFVAGGRPPKANGANLMEPDYPLPRFSGEVFSPPYLDFATLQRTRPRFESPLPPASVNFGDTFQVTVRHDLDATEGDIDAIILLRPAAVTHHWDADQRYIELVFSPNNDAQNDGTEVVESFTVQAPADTLGPAGYYMLFVVEDDNPGLSACTIEGHRVPSVAHFLNIQ